MAPFEILLRAFPAEAQKGPIPLKTATGCNVVWARLDRSVRWPMGNPVVADSGVNNGFKGELPKGCPPADSANVPAGYLLRLVPSNPCTAEHFRSGHAEGKKQPKTCDLCTWMSCSVWTADTPHENLAGLAKLKNLAHMKFVARFRVAGNEGKIKPHEKDSRHLSFWMRESFAPEAAVEEYKPL